MKRYDVKTAEDLIFIPCHLNTNQKIERTKELINYYSVCPTTFDDALKLYRDVMAKSV